MAGDTQITLNPGSGGQNVAVVQDNLGNMHQKVVLETEVSSLPVPVSTSNPLPVAQQGNQTVVGLVASGAVNSGNPVKVAGAFNSSPITVSNGQIVDIQVDANGYLKVNIAAGTSAGGTSSTVGSAAPTTATAIGATDGTNMQLVHVDGSGNLKVNIAAGGVPAGQDNTSFTAGTTQGLILEGVYNDGVSSLTTGNQGAVRLTVDRKQYVAAGVAVSGGASAFGLRSANTTNATSVKGSAGQLYYVSAQNNGGAAAYIKLYNTASTPTAGAGTPLQVFMVPSGGGNNFTPSVGVVFSSGIGFTVTGGASDTDTTAVSSNQVTLNIGYA